MAHATGRPPAEIGPPVGASLASFAGLSSALRGWRGLYAFAVIMNVVSVCAAAAATSLGALAVSTAILGGAPTNLTPIVMSVAVVVGIRGVASWLESWISHDLSFRMMARVRSWVFGALARLAPGGIARRRTGDLATATMTDAEALEIFYAHSSLYITSAFITTPILLAGVAVISPPTALALIPAVIIVAAVPLLLRRSAKRGGARIRSLIACLGAEVNENVGAVREIVGFGMTNDRMARIEKIDDELSSVQLRNARRAGLESATGGVISVLATLVAALIGVAQISASALDPLLLPVAITLAGSTPAAIIQWIGVTRHYGTTNEAAARIDALLSAPPPVDRTGQDGGSGGKAVDVGIERVSYNWPGPNELDTPTLALRDVELHIRAGERIAIAGRSGAGKSTLAAILARFMDPDTGIVRLDGRDIRSLRPDALTASVCLVPQEVYLFHESVRDNLALATDRTVTDSELWVALESSFADSIVRRMPGGLDSIIGERGTTLSGGERQRLALARAAIQDSQVLILDETVSQLDVESERDVRDALTSAHSERTTIVIAHRLSTLLGAQRIVVVDEGRVVDDGTHKELIARCEVYRDLVEPQLTALRGVRRPTTKPRAHEEGASEK